MSSRFALSIAALALLATACSTAPGTQAPRLGSDIVIGVPNSASGQLSTEGGQSKQGYDLWQDWANRNGGIVAGGVRHRVRLVYQDDQSQPQLSAQIAQTMITQQKVQFLLSPYGTTTTLAVAPVAEKYHVPMINSNGAAAQVPQGSHYTFGIMALASQYPAAVIDWEAAQATPPHSIAITTADDDASLLIAQATAQYSQTKGVKVVFFQKYPAGTTNLYSLVQQAKATNPDVFFNSGHFLEAVAAHKAAKDLGLDAKLFAYGVGPTQPEFVQALGPAADYVVTAAPWTAQARFKAAYGPSTVQYVSTYRQKYHTQQEPGFITADSTAAGLALEAAIEQSQSLDPEKVRAALASLDINTFYGRIKFDAQGLNTFHNVLVLQIQNGQRQTVWPPELASAMAEYPTPTWTARFGAAAQQPGAKPKLPGTGAP